MLFFLLFVFFINNPGSIGAKPKSGPFNLKVFNLTDCGKRLSGEMTFDLNVESYNETTDIVEGSVKIPLGFGDDMNVAIDVSRWEDHAWVEKTHTFNLTKMCSGMRSAMKETFAHVTQHLKVDNSCPISAGSYKVKDLLLTLKTNLVKEAVYGVYKARLVARKDGALGGCLDAILAVTQKDT